MTRRTLSANGLLAVAMVTLAGRSSSFQTTPIRPNISGNSAFQSALWNAGINERNEAKVVGGTAAKRGIFARRKIQQQAVLALARSASALGATAAVNLDIGKQGGGGPETKPFNPGPTISFGPNKSLKANWFTLFYTIVSTPLSILWWMGLTIADFVYKVFPKVDPNRYFPVWCGHCWGMATMRMTMCFPKMTGRENLATVNGKDGKSKRPCMFVANHCSWMDIPFLAAAIGWQNYKMVSKSELMKVPVLSKSLRVCQHVVLDRTSRRSQLETYKSGVSWLKKGVSLCTFAEGTRSRDGRLQPFKKGAFKMAQAVGAPIVPVTIKYAHIVQPIEYIWPCRPARLVPAEVVVGKPIETEGKDDEQVMDEVRQAMIDELPECQRPE